jgi:hypothetical protein
MVALTAFEQESTAFRWQVDEDPLFCGNRPILVFMRAEEALLYAEHSPIKEIMRTEDPLFYGYRPVMEFTRTEDPLLYHNHGLIRDKSRNSGSLVRILLRNR